MKKLTILLACTFVLGSPLCAAEGDKPAAPAEDKPAAAAGGKRARGGAKGERPARILRDLDKNTNHQIDGEEIDALKKQFEGTPKGPLARFDKNGDSKLDDDEVKGLNEMMAKRGQGKGGARRKKNQ